MCPWRRASVTPFGVPVRSITVRIGGSAGPRDGGAVIRPDRLLRAWCALKGVAAELPVAEPADGTAARVAGLVERLRAEVAGSVSAPLAAEVRGLAPVLGAASPWRDVRLTSAGLLGWTESLVSEMLRDLAGAAQALAPPPHRGKTLPVRRSGGPS